MYIIRYTKSYIKRAEKFVKRYTELIEQYKKSMKILETNPYHPSLRLNKLEGKLSELYSV